MPRREGSSIDGIILPAFSCANFEYVMKPWERPSKGIFKALPKPISTTHAPKSTATDRSTLFRGVCGNATNMGVLADVLKRIVCF